MGSKLKIVTTSLLNNPGPGSYDVNKSSESATNGGTGKYTGAKWAFPKEIRRINNDVIKKALN
jgi:hypothetical protein